MAKIPNKLLWIKNEAQQRIHKSKMDYTVFFCCGLAFILYLNTLNAGFVYDDRRAILANTDVSSSIKWQRLFTNDFWGTPLKDSGSHGSWRPLCILSFRLNYLFGGGYAPWGFHLVNNLLHCVATGLVIQVARTLLRSFWGVLVTGALFAAHPIHTEAVAGVVGRADVAACVSYLLTYLIYLRHIRWREQGDPRQWLPLMLTILFSLIALLFKETAITALLLCAFLDVIRGLCGFADKNRRRSLVILGVALLSTIYCRLIMIPRPQTAFSMADNPIAREPSFLTRLLTFLYMPVFNFKLLLYPQLLSFDWGMDAVPRITTIFERRNLHVLCFYGALFVIGYRSLTSLCDIRKSNAAASHVPYTQYQLQPQLTRKSRSKRKRVALHTEAESKYIYDATIGHQLTYGSLPLSRQLGSSICRDCNNNNITLTPSLVYSEESGFCHPLVSSNGGSSSHHVMNIAFHKTLAAVVSPRRSSRSSSSCSSSTTSSNKSSGSQSSSISSCSSLDSLAMRLGMANNITDELYMLKHLPQNVANSCVLLVSCAFLTLPFLPATNLFFYVGFVVAERLLYLPSVGFCLLVGFGVSKLLHDRSSGAKNGVGKVLLALAIGILLGTASVRTVRRNLDWRDEESLYRSAIAANPPKALGNLGSILSSQSRFKEAKATLIEALKYRPNMADVHFNLGILHQNQHEYEAAVECFQRAIHYRPNLAVAYLNLGISFIAMGRRQKAIEALQLGARLEGAGVRDRSAHEQARCSSYLQLGGLYVEQGKLQRALAVYREALAALPKHFPQLNMVYQRIGDVFGRLQQWDEAERHHRVALALQPNQVSAHLSYGITLARNSSRASEAEMWFRRALQLAPEQASVCHHYAEFLAMQGRNQEAVVYHLRAAENAPNEYSFVVAAATSLRLLDRKIEAELWYRKATNLRPKDAHAHTNLGAILHLLGRTRKAAASYKEALRLQPGDPITLGNLAKLGTPTLHV